MVRGALTEALEFRICQGKSGQLTDSIISKAAQGTSSWLSEF